MQNYFKQNFKYVLCICLLVIPINAYSQPSPPPIPVMVELTGTEDTVNFGDVIQLKAVINNGKIPENIADIKYQWYIFEDGIKITKGLIVWPDGTQIFFGAGVKPRKVTVALSVSCLFTNKSQIKVTDPVGQSLEGAKIVTSDGKTITSAITDSYLVAADLTTKTITIGAQPSPDPDPTPVPPTPVFPVGRFGLAKTAFTLTNNISADHRSEAAALATSYANIADRINQSISKQAAGIALTNEDVKLDVQSMIAAVAASNKVALGTSVSIWQDWNKSYGDEIYGMYKDKKIVGPADWRDAFIETANGLRLVK